MSLPQAPRPPAGAGLIYSPWPTLTPSVTSTLKTQVSDRAGRKVSIQTRRELTSHLPGSTGPSGCPKAVSWLVNHFSGHQRRQSSRHGSQACVSRQDTGLLLLSACRPRPSVLSCGTILLPHAMGRRLKPFPSPQYTPPFGFQPRTLSSGRPACGTPQHTLPEVRPL